jgi:hypothetical protein
MDYNLINYRHNDLLNYLGCSDMCWVNWIIQLMLREEITIVADWHIYRYLDSKP